MKATRQAFAEINGILSNLTGEIDTNFAMYVNINIKKLASLMEEIKGIYEDGKMSEAYQRFGQQEIDLLNQYAERDANNQPISVGKNSYAIKKDCIKVYQESKTQLLEEYKDVIEQQETITKQANELLAEEVEVELVQIPFKVFPNTFDKDDLMKLMDLIKDFEA